MVPNLGNLKVTLFGSFGDTFLIILGTTFGEITFDGGTTFGEITSRKQCREITFDGAFMSSGV